MTYARVPPLTFNLHLLSVLGKCNLSRTWVQESTTDRTTNCPSIPLKKQAYNVTAVPGDQIVSQPLISSSHHILSFSIARVPLSS